MGELWKDFCPTFSNGYLKTLPEGDVTPEAGSLFQYFTTLTKNADPLDRRWLALWSTLKRCPHRTRRVEGKQFRIYTQKALEYVEGGNQVAPKSSQLGCRSQVRLLGHLLDWIYLLTRLQRSALRPLCTENTCTLAGSVICKRIL